MASDELPELCHTYLHDIEFRDMGKYSFKGIHGQYDVLQVNTASIAGRNEYFSPELPLGKAKKISNGEGHVEVRWTSCSEVYPVHCDIELYL